MSAERDEPEKLEGDDLLAAEYALGVLDGDARATVQARLAQDVELAARVDAWNEKLAPLADSLEPIAPPASVKAQLNARLFGEASPQSTGITGWFESLAFWRTATGVAASAAVVAITLALVPAPVELPETELAPGYFAALRADDASPVVLVRYDPDSESLFISGPIGQEEAQPVQPELWVIPPGEGQAPRSLGLIASVSGELTERVAIDNQLGRDIAQGAVLAISLEPPGGSPTGAPTGPVIALGSVQSL